MEKIIAPRFYKKHAWFNFYAVSGEQFVASPTSYGRSETVAPSMAASDGKKASTDLRQGMLRQTEWQQQIESLLSRVELKDLLAAIDYERMSKSANLLGRPRIG